MVKLLQAKDVNAAQEAVDADLTAAEESEARARFAPTGTPGDLSDGGMVNGAKLTPMIGGRPSPEGRAVARRAWMWNGTPSVLPLGWNPDGTLHDGGRKYLLKRTCMCCYAGGFRGSQCPSCRKNNCSRCRGATMPHKLIPTFYLREEDVPFPVETHGDIACFMPSCYRRNADGFLTQEAMRFHAATKHKMEYQAHQEAAQASEKSEIATLRARLDAMTRMPIAPPAEVRPKAKMGRPSNKDKAAALAAAGSSSISSTKE